MSFLTSSNWWRRSWRLAANFAPRCMLPAFCLAAANVSIMLGVAKMSVLQALDSPLESLLHELTFGAVCLLLGLILTCWSLSAWLVLLTAFSRFCLIEHAPIEQCLAEVKRRKGMLAKLWSIAALYLTPPVSILSLLIALQLLSGTSLSGNELMLLPNWPGAGMLVGAAIMFISALITAYAIVVLLLSSVSETGAGETSWRAFRIFARNCLPVLALSFLALALNASISTPQVFSSGHSLDDLFKQNIYACVALQLWFAFTSAILWPFSIIPFCDLLGGSVRK